MNVWLLCLQARYHLLQRQGASLPCVMFNFVFSIPWTSRLSALSLILDAEQQILRLLIKLQAIYLE